MTVYLVGWIACCLAALAFYIREPGAYAPSHRSYWRYLAAPWKLATFTIAALGITLIAPYTGDPTWDYFDAAMMAVLTFVTAPWALATLYLCARRKLPLRHAFVAACAWLFSASWCYDAYLLWRDGYYPVTWSANLVASSILIYGGGTLLEPGLAGGARRDLRIPRAGVAPASGRRRFPPHRLDRAAVHGARRDPHPPICLWLISKSASEGRGVALA